MNSSLRIWKTVACLVASMTGTTLLLGWMDPSRSKRGSEFSEEHLLEWARRAVASEVPIDPSRWQSIEVDSAPRSLVFNGMLLAVEAAPATYHFLIDDSGLPKAGLPWREQRSLEGEPYAVRISMIGEIPEPWSGSHWAGVQAVVTALNEQLRPGDYGLPVNLVLNSHSADREVRGVMLAASMTGVQQSR